MKRTIFILAFAVGCSSNNGGEPAAEAEDAGADVVIVDAASDTKVDKSATCASDFGTALTDAFGRADGTVTAIVAPTVTKCALPNDDHVVLQMKMNGAVYRMVINVQSSFGSDLRVRFATIDHAPLGDTWSEGWHPGVRLDYPSMLDIHTSDARFVPYDMLPLSEQIESAIDLGVKISVYAWSSGGASAHKVHRNANNGDGAIVIDPNGSNPKWLLFHFANQTF